MQIRRTTLRLDEDTFKNFNIKLAEIGISKQNFLENCVKSLIENDKKIIDMIEKTKKRE